MKAPLSWLSEYVSITSKPKALGDKLTEIGLGTEKIEKIDDDIIFDFEITPNRPDLLSILGIAREIAAIEKKNIKIPEAYQGIEKIKPDKILPLKITTDSSINPRFTGIIIDGITVGESPKWLKDKLEKMGQRSINNIVDITNFVMLETGNPIHAFDYDKIKGKVMRVHQTKGGEKFISVDGITYHLPKGAVVISDEERIIDLCGIKGGENSGTYENTKTIFLRVPVEIPALVRRTSQSLGLRSEASSIFERGVNREGTKDALARAVKLILEISGGEIASPLYDIKKLEFLPWHVDLDLSRLSKILGIDIPKEKVIDILERLNLKSKKISEDKLRITIPTYRNDLQIEEDLIEEVARIYGYNNFPKTYPHGIIPTQKNPYFKNYKEEKGIKEILRACGYSEIYTYSLISEEDLIKYGVNPDIALRVDNPVSREFEYLRPTLRGNLKKAVTQNEPNFSKVSLFELGKVYQGKSIDEAREFNVLSGISNSKNYLEIKGLLEMLFSKYGLDENPSKFIQVVDEGIFFEIEYDRLMKASRIIKFKPVPKYPPVIEDMSFEIDEKHAIGDVIDSIKKQNQLISSVELLDIFGDKKTFRITYLNKAGNLSTKDVEKIRKKIEEELSQKFKAQLV